MPSRFGPAPTGAARKLAEVAAKSSVLMALMVGATAAVGLSSAVAAQPRFTDAVAAYDQGDFATAASTFRALASASPRNADAWANAGTAAWAASDTAYAVLAWQRALRLEPRALDLRTRLSALGSNVLTGVASVPAVSVNTVFVAALVLWGVAWLLLAIAPRRPGAAASPLYIVGTMLVVLSAGAGLWQFVLQKKLSGQSLVVMSERQAIRVAPGGEANAIGDALLGDVLSRGEPRLDAVRGERWFAVQHADGREGWLPERVLRSLR